MPSKPNPNTRLDPLNINARLYNQVGALLTQLETSESVTLKERVQALVAIGRIQTIFLAMRLKEKVDEPTSGSAVRKYATAFEAHGARRRKASAGAAASEPDTDIDDLIGADDDGDDDAA